MSTKSGFLFLGLALVGWAIGCGTSDQKGGPGPVPANPGTPIPANQIPAQPNGQPVPPITDIPEPIMNLLIGTYETRLTHDDIADDMISEAITLILGQVVTAGTNARYATLHLMSYGNLGNLDISLFATASRTPSFSFSPIHYTFQSLPFLVASLSEYPIAIQMDLAVNYDNSFNPTQSRIYFLDCGFYQSACYSQLNDVRTGPVVRRY